MTAPVTVKVGSTTITNPAGVQWLDELNSTGSGQFKLPMTDAQVSVVNYDLVVTFSYESGDRFAWLVESIEWGVVDEAGSRWLAVSGRGLLAWLENAAVYPPGGMAATTPDAREFSYASADIFDHDLQVTWGTAVAVAWATADFPASGYPLEWGDLDPPAGADLIWSTDPTDTLTDAECWFRKSFTVSTAPVNSRWFLSGDGLDMVAWLDGEQIMALDGTGQRPYLWNFMDTADRELSVGTHTVAIRDYGGTGGGSFNVSNVMLAAYSLTDTVDDTVGILDSVILVTDNTWGVSNTEPWWTPGDVLYTLVTEAQSRSVDGVSDLTMDFDADIDSNSVAWSTAVRRSWDVVTTNLLTVALDLAELGVDVWVTPDKVLHCAETRGGAKSVTLTDDTNITRWAMSGQRATATHAWVRTDRGWVEQADTTGVSTYGRRELGLQTGNTDSDLTATAVAQAAFAEAAAPVETITQTELVPISGAKAYVDFGVADTVTGIDKTGAAASVRLLSLTVVQDDNGIVTYTPEFEEV